MSRCISLFLVLGAAPVVAGEPFSATHLLKLSEASHNSCKNMQLSLKTECKVGPDFSVTRSTIKSAAVSYLRMGPLFKVNGLLSHQGVRDPTEVEYVMNKHAFLIASLNTRERGFTHYQASALPKKHLGYLLDNPLLGASMDGYFPGGDGLSLWASLVPDPLVSREKVGGELCSVLKGRVAQGKVTLWLSPRHSIKKYTLTYDHIGYRPQETSSPIFPRFATVENTAFQVFGSKEVPTKGTLTFPNIQYVYARDHVILDPVHPLRAFDTYVPARCEVTNLDDHESGVHYTLLNEQIVPLGSGREDHSVRVDRVSTGPGQRRPVLLLCAIGFVSGFLALWFLYRERGRHIRPLLAFATIVCWPSPTSVQGFPSYSGIRSVVRAVGYHGKEASLAELLSPKYLSVRWGSTPDDLVRAVRDLGFAATIRNDLNGLVLQSVSCPVVLHVKEAGPTGPYRFWALFEGYKGGDALIYEGSTGETRWIDFRDLAARWDGLGILIEPDGADNSVSLTTTLVSQWIFAGGLALGMFACCVYAVRRLQGGNQAILRAVSIDLSLIFMVVFTWVFFSKWCHPEGFLSSDVALEEIQANQLCLLLPRVGPEKLAKLEKDSSFLIIDGRPPTEYAKDHLESSINIPSVFSLEDVERLVGPHDPSCTTVFLRCESDASYCAMVRKLRKLGFNRILLNEERESG